MVTKWSPSGLLVVSQMLIVTGGWDAFYQATPSTEVATIFFCPETTVQSFFQQVFNYSEGGEWRLVAFSYIFGIFENFWHFHNLDIICGEKRHLRWM